MKAIKLVYIAHGWYLALKNEELVDVPIEAWTYGPVIPSLYNQLRVFGRNSISEPITHDNQGNVVPEVDNEEDLTFLDKIWEQYGELSALQLSALTHQMDTPWSETRRSGLPSGIISRELIRNHYLHLMNNG